MTSNLPEKKNLRDNKKKRLIFFACERAKDYF